MELDVRPIDRERAAALGVADATYLLAIARLLARTDFATLAWADHNDAIGTLQMNAAELLDGLPEAPGKPRFTPDGFLIDYEDARVELAVLDNGRLDTTPAYYVIHRASTWDDYDQCNGSWITAASAPIESWSNVSYLFGDGRDPQSGRVRYSRAALQMYEVATDGEDLERVRAAEKRGWLRMAFSTEI